MRHLFKKIIAELKNGAADILLSSLFVKCFSLCSSIVVVRILNKADYGTLSYVENGYSYILLLAGLGLGNALLRYVPRVKEIEKRKAYLQFSMKCGLLVQGCIAAVLIPVFCMLPVDYPFAKSLILLFALKPLFAYAFDTLLNYLRAIEKNRLYAIISCLFISFNFVFLIVFTLLWKLRGVVLARYLAYLIPVVICFYIIRKGLAKAACKPLKKQEYQEYILFGFMLMISSLLSSVMPMNDMMLINLIIKSEIVSANYKIALMIPLNLPFITNAILTYIYPKFAYNSDDRQWVWKNIKLVTVITVSIMTGVCLLIIIFARPVILILYGEKYLEVVPLMRMLTIIIGFNTAVRMLPMSLLPALGKVKINLIVAGISCVVQIAADYIAISRFGIYGVVFSLGFIYIVTACVYWMYLYHVTHYDERRFKDESG